MSVNPMNSDIQQRILRDMSEGVFLLGTNGVIQLTNPVLCKILAMPGETLEGSSFAELFFWNADNDAFAQMVLNAVHDKHMSHRDVVPYTTPDGEKKDLLVTTSFLRNGGEQEGIIGVISDVTEQTRLQKELLLRQRQLDELLDSMVETLATAIDERSPYTANHTRNIVRFAEHFLDYLERTGDPRAFDRERRRAFIMCVQLHDIGKLVVPLEIMDKADRLGRRYSDLRERFRVMELLDTIAQLRGTLERETAEQRSRERADALACIDRINRAGFLTDEDLQAVETIAGRIYVDEQQQTHPWIDEEERLCLSIRKGTLTEKEREVIQLHATQTMRILEHVRFPDQLRQVPQWASSHHEFLNGKGYPLHVSGDSIPAEVRLLTILDIFEALTAKDRPYKKSLPVDRSLAILHSMVEEGCLDGEWLAVFEQSRAWES